MTKESEAQMNARCDIVCMTTLYMHCVYQNCNKCAMYDRCEMFLNSKYYAITIYSEGEV